MEIGFINSPERWRDVFIMSFMVAGTLFFLLGIIFTIVSGFLSIRVLRRARSLLKEGVAPSLQNVRETTANIRGTVEFISDTAIRPVVTAYGVIVGVRRFVVVASGFSKRRRRG